MGEVFLPFRTAKPRSVVEARSTLIVSGIQTARAHGISERYSELLAPHVRNDLMALVAGLWIPYELALEHYRAMDRLELPKSTIEAIGAEVAERGSRTTLAGVTGMDRTPWKMFLMSHRNLDTNWRGSDVMVSKEGPQQAMFIWAGQPCASVPYFVTSWGAFLHAMTSLYCTRATHRIARELCTPTTIAIELSWI